MQRPVLLLGLGSILVAATSTAQSLRAPDPIAVYYGYPSGVNGATSIPQAAQVFAAYVRVVIGDGLEDPSHPDHANTVAIIAAVPTTAFYGYIPLGNLGGNGLTRAVIQTRIGQWLAMGVRGIFLDEAGYDFNVSRQRQLDALTDVHARSLHAWVNAWVAGDVFGAQVHPQNPQGLTTGMTAQDRYLLESFQIVNGDYEPVAQFVARADAARSYAQAFGSAIEAVTTSLVGQTYDQARMDYAWWSVALNGFAGMGWGEPEFSALNSQMPYRARPNPTLSGSWLSGVIHAPTLPLHQRVASSGHLRLDTAQRRGSFVPMQISGPSRAPLAQPSTFALQAATSAGMPYATVATETATPGVIWIDGRTLPVSLGPLLSLSLTPSPVFNGFTGTLDSAGRATSILTLPNLPSLSGASIALVGIVLDANAPELIRVFSQPHAVQFQ